MDSKKSYGMYYFGSSVGPHSITNRLTLTNNYSVTMRITCLNLMYERATAAGTPSNVQLKATYTESGGSQSTVLILRYSGNTVGDRQMVQLAMPIHLFPNDQLAVSTVDNSTGGTMHYWANIVYEWI